MTDRDFAIQVVERLQSSGFKAYFAGGCVRDQLLDLPPADYDIATDALPEQVKPLFKRTFEVGAAFGVIEVIGPRKADHTFHRVQVATFRTDFDYQDGRRPERVVFSTPQEDACRRDFTINGMFYDPLKDQLIDFVNGQEDLKKQCLRAIGDPKERFREDKLRMLRAVRMAIRFNLTFDPATESAIQQLAAGIQEISAERIAEELRKLLPHPRRADALRKMLELNLLFEIIPEIEEMIGLPQGLPSQPRGDLWAHVLQVLHNLSAIPQVSFPLAMAALLHDIGKKRTMGRTPEKYTFYNHEFVGKEMAYKIATRLKLSNEERTRICWLVEKHQYLSDAPTMRPSRLYPVLIHPAIGELLALHRADALAAERPTHHVEFCEQLLQNVPSQMLNPDPLITGNDLLDMGIPAGPVFKELLEQSRSDQLDGKLLSKEQALNQIRNNFASSTTSSATTNHG